MLKEVKAAREKMAPEQVQLVSQLVAGGDGSVYYITQLKPDMAGFDGVPGAMKLLGEDGYQKWLKTNAEVVQGARLVIMRYSPEMSSPQPEVAAVNPDFWNPKPVMAAKKQGKKTQAEGR